MLSLGALTCQKQPLLRGFIISPSLFLFFRARQKNWDERQGRPAAAICAVERSRSKAPLPPGVVFSLFWRSLEFLLMTKPLVDRGRCCALERTIKKALDF